MRNCVNMSNTSCNALPSRVELPPSRWPARLWVGSVLLAFAALLLSALTGAAALAVGGLIVWVASLEWRGRIEPVSLLWHPGAVSCQLSDGRVLEAPWPLPGMVCPFWISLRFPGRFRRRLRVTLYRDQLSADDFRRLRVLMRG